VCEREEKKKKKKKERKKKEKKLIFFCVIDITVGVLNKDPYGVLKVLWRREVHS
jgi:hypothetical protein